MGWGGGVSETDKEAKIYRQGYTSKDPHAEQPLLPGAAFLRACPELLSFNAYFLPWQVPVGTVHYGRVIGIAVVVSILCLWSLTYNNIGILMLF